ncbi:flagellar hook-basal body complex protein FliE [Permianibacter sp. IMCC34836]|uniref:flagellar hook-basal body complex protein FliE n=1 Tax=Permianibacter fluminis TaxID=2738515 RepID=UPI001552F0C5|nr:flagellar hook-basal body complex protein FliE [Permianibacter fluminis]NQD38040.1 flagellar hook-basal body complex protein FliE [Permianibacter fluminis]
MSTIDRTQLLQELRALASQAGRTESAGQVLNKSSGVSGVQQFSSLFSQALGNVNQLQQQAEGLQTRVEMGDKSVSLVQAMVASQKASIAFQATVQVRNRLVAAYQDIMNMPI